MDQSTTSPDQPTLAETDSDMEFPPGNHPAEVAARRGIGPLSPHSAEIWHGHARPCVSCGQLVHRDAAECDDCGQDLTPGMIEKMRAHAGPWYVLEHVRPFPGVNLDRIIRQLRRGLITPTSIVRGPSTDYQWRFAVETPGLCRYFGRCWSCQQTVAPSDARCPSCATFLSFEQPKDSSFPAAAPPSRPLESTVTEIPAGELQELSAAVRRAEPALRETGWDAPPRIGGVRVSWIAAILMIGVMMILVWVTGSRPSTPPPPATPIPATSSSTGP